MDFDYRSHIFSCIQFKRIVNEAIDFFNNTPLISLPPPGDFLGNGVYALYYRGGFDLYDRITVANRKSVKQPIYIGKAVPQGWRTARSVDSTAPVLYRRLQEHSGVLIR